MGLFERGKALPSCLVFYFMLGPFEQHVSNISNAHIRWLSKNSSNENVVNLKQYIFQHIQFKKIATALIQ